MANVVADFVAKLGLKPDVKSWSKGDELISKVKAGIAAFAGFKAIQAVTGWVKATATVADEARKTSQRLGVTTEALQELDHAASLSGVSGEELRGGLTKLGKGLDDVATKGKGPAADALRRLGISFRDLKDESIDQNLEVIADRFAKMPDGPKKTALAMDLFGKSGARLIPMLNAGKDGIVEMRNEAHRLGIVIDDETGKAFEQLNDDQDRLRKTFAGLRNQVVIALLPTFQKLVDGIREWVEQNREVIKASIAAAVQTVIRVLKVLGTVVRGIVKVIQFFVENSELGKSVLIALGLVIAAFAAKAAVAWAIAFAPIIAAVAVLAGLVLAMRMLIKHWDKVKGAVRSAGRAIVGALNSAWQGVKDAGNRIAKFFTEDIPNAIADAFAALWDKVKQGASDAASWLRNAPVIKQVLDVGGFIKDDLLGGGGVSSDAVQDAIRRNQEATRDAGGPTASAGGVSVRGGDVKIEINSATGDPVAIGREVDKRIHEHMETLLQQAAEAVG